MAFTCSPDRPVGHQVLSVRCVPTGVSHLDQGLYDGPTLDLPHTWDMDNEGGLEDVGVGPAAHHEVYEHVGVGADGSGSSSSGSETGLGLKGLDDLSRRLLEEGADGSGAAVSGEEEEEDEEDDGDDDDDDGEEGRHRHGLHAVTGGLHAYLAERGVESRSLAMARLYATHKYRQERLAGQQFLYSFLAK